MPAGRVPSADVFDPAQLAAFGRDDIEVAPSHPLLDAPPPAYSPRLQSPSEKADAPLKDSKEKARATDTVSRGGPSRLTLPQSLAGSCQGLFNIFDGTKQAVAKQLRSLMQQLLAARSRNDQDTVVALDEAIETTSRKYSINRWRLESQEVLQSELDVRSSEARQALLQGDDELCARLVSSIAQILAAQSFLGTVRLSQVSTAIEPGDTAIHIAFAKNLKLTSRAFFQCEPSRCAREVVVHLQDQLITFLRNGNLSEAVLAKDKIFEALASMERWSQELNVSLYGYAALRDNDWRPRGGSNTLLLAFRGNPAFDDIKFQSDGHQDQLVLKLPHLRHKHWLSFAVALGLYPHELSALTDTGANLALLRLNIPAIIYSGYIPYNVLLTACLCDSIDVVEVLEPGKWSGEEPLSKDAIKELSAAIALAETRSNAVTFLQRYRERSSIGASGLTHFAFDARTAPHLPEDLLLWLKS